MRLNTMAKKSKFVFKQTSNKIFEKIGSVASFSLFLHLNWPPPFMLLRASVEYQQPIPFPPTTNLNQNPLILWAKQFFE